MSLSEQVTAPSTRPAVVADLSQVVEGEVKRKSGLSGAAIKGAYAAAKKAVPAIPSGAVDELLPAFAQALDPYWEASGGQGDFGAYLGSRGDEVAESLLAITDQRAAASGREPVKKAYKTLRPKALENVKAALPAIGSTLQKHASA